jgi:mono/diheme cytochrome c family protein
VRKKLVWILLALTVSVLLAAVFVRGMGISARREPTALEARLAKAAWRFLVPREYRKMTNPVPVEAKVIRAALEHWADHCATCHGNDGSGDVRLGRSLHPRAPDMRTTATQRLTDGELFYAIEHGIPFTGMPAWGTGTDDGVRASWELVHFVRYLPKLSADEIRDMEGLNPRSAAADRAKEAIDDFLSGKSPIRK